MNIKLSYYYARFNRHAFHLMGRLISLYLLMICVMLAGCSEKNSEQRSMVEEWIGKEIRFPENLVCQIGSSHLDLNDILSGSYYKIVTFIDSAGCVPCRMKMNSWTEFLDKVNSIPDNDVRFLMILNTSEIKNMTYLLNRDRFLHPVSLDKDNAFFNLNGLSDKEQYQTFLLDCENRIVALGSPVDNPKIEKFYLRTLSENSASLPPDGIDIVRHASRSLGIVHPGDTASAVFTFENNDSTKHYHIMGLVPSCECTEASIISGEELAPFKSVKLEVRYVGDSVAGPFQRYVDVFFDEIENPGRVTVYGFIK